VPSNWSPDLTALRHQLTASIDHDMRPLTTAEYVNSILES
jgi:hypothetical protein